MSNAKIDDKFYSLQSEMSTKYLQLNEKYRNEVAFLSLN
ncbi:hypothetical protein CCYN2B_170003 [Capnocytophaga cynodegmi]|uniref:Uncharacterized protein n=1 Tax=Capnocytophaga cynodegmi TaxID=28189 RepID=A0A0B7H1H9_9FLAO|nr:hypothetical protein CCYN2B_170003 [Capnocytophaga cynodegmi]